MWLFVFGDLLFDSKTMWIRFGLDFLKRRPKGCSMLLDYVRFRVLKWTRKNPSCSVLVVLDLQAGCMSVTSVHPFHGTPLWWPTSITRCQGEAIDKSLRYLDDIPNLKTTNWPLEDCSCSRYSSVYDITVIGKCFFVLWVEFGVSTWFVSTSRKTSWLIQKVVVSINYPNGRF